MAVIQKIRDLFSFEDERNSAESTLRTNYEIRPALIDRLEEIYRASQRCFKSDESYSKKIFRYLLSSPKTVSYCALTPQDRIAAFIFASVEDDGTGHISTIGVLPEHRRRGLAKKLISYTEEILAKKGATTVKLEVRISNFEAQSLYRKLGYTAVQRLHSYYNDGEDGFLMVKSLL